MFDTRPFQVPECNGRVLTIQRQEEQTLSHGRKSPIKLSSKGNHTSMRNVELRGPLPILLASGDFCLAERMLNGFVEFGGHDVHIHPQLSAITFDDSNISSAYAVNSSWSVRFNGHVLLGDCSHSRLVGNLSPRRREPRKHLRWRYSLAGAHATSRSNVASKALSGTPSESSIWQRGGFSESPGEAPEPRTLALEPLGLGRFIAKKINCASVRTAQYSGESAFWPKAHCSKECSGSA